MSKAQPQDNAKTPLTEQDVKDEMYVIMNCQKELSSLGSDARNRVIDWLRSWAIAEASGHFHDSHPF